MDCRYVFFEHISPIDLDFFEDDEKDSDVGPPHNVRQQQQEWNEVSLTQSMKQRGDVHDTYWCKYFQAHT